MAMMKHHVEAVARTRRSTAYLALVENHTLKPPEDSVQRISALRVAAYIGSMRSIDNDSVLRIARLRAVGDVDFKLARLSWTHSV